MTGIRLDQFIGFEYGAISNEVATTSGTPTAIDLFVDSGWDRSDFGTGNPPNGRWCAELGASDYFESGTGSLGGIAVNTLSMGFRMRTTALPASSETILIIYGDYASTPVTNFDLQINSSGTLSLRDAGGTARVTSTATISADTWYYINIQSYNDNTTGSLRLDIDGTNEGSATSIDTRGGTGAAHDGYRFTNGGTGTLYIDDIYFGLADSGTGALDADNVYSNLSVYGSVVNRTNSDLEATPDYNASGTTTDLDTNYWSYTNDRDVSTTSATYGADPSGGTALIQLPSNTTGFETFWSSANTGKKCYPQRLLHWGYVDASNSGPTDAQSVWTDDSNAVDGSISTYASVNSTGTPTNNALVISGVNLPAADPGTVNQVFYRFYGGPESGPTSMRVWAYVNGSSTVSGSAGRSITTPGWSDWTQVIWYADAPIDSYPNWTNINTLEFKAHRFSGTGVCRLYAIEVLVFGPVTPMSNNYYYFDGSSSDPGGVWNNDANLFDGATNTYVDNTTGTGSSNYLGAIGTTAPTNGTRAANGAIAAVHVAVQGTGGDDDARLEIRSAGADRQVQEAYEIANFMTGADNQPNQAASTDNGEEGSSYWHIVPCEDRQRSWWWDEAGNLEARLWINANGTTAGRYRRVRQNVLTYNDVTLNTYYIDASDSGPTDSGAAWTNDSNAFDANESTAATTTTNSQSLIAVGTNAPASGDPITDVFVALVLDSTSTAQITCNVYDSGDGVILLNSLVSESISATKEEVEIGFLRRPRNKWTWEKVQRLRVDVSRSSGTGTLSYFAAKVYVLTAAPGKTAGAIVGAKGNYNVDRDGGGGTVHTLCLGTTSHFIVPGDVTTLDTGQAWYEVNWPGGTYSASEYDVPTFAEEMVIGLEVDGAQNVNIWQLVGMIAVENVTADAAAVSGNPNYYYRMIGRQ
jgi:hypothetical protein